MKAVRFILKVLAVSMTVAAAACCVIAYWDKIAELWCYAKNKLAGKHPCCCHSSEYDDYADFDEG
ncbi:MAG: hypothetical protein RRY65_00955 [Pseudoflavonifractor sp.]